MKKIIFAAVFTLFALTNSFAQMGGQGGGPIIGSATFVQCGSSPTSIGGGAAFLVNATDPTNDPIFSVSYSITGGAYSDQVIPAGYTSCTNIPTTGNTSGYGPIGVPSSGGGWYWNENPGSKSVDITVTLKSGTVVTKTYTYDVDEPYVQWITIAGQADFMGPFDSDSKFGIGLAHGSGVAISSKTDIKSSGGSLGFIQKAQVYTKMTDKNGHWWKTDCPNNVLDFAPPGPAMWEDLQFVNAWANNKPNNMFDEPEFWVATSSPGNIVHLETVMNFETALAFRPEDGIVVGIARVYWEMSISVRYVGPANPTLAQYINVANWTKDVSSHPTSWSYNGDIETFPIHWEETRSDLDNYKSEGDN